MGRDPLQTHAISYNSQYNPTNHGSRVLRHTDGLNLSNSCVSVAFLFLITHISADQSTFVGYPSEDCRQYSVDKFQVQSKSLYQNNLIQNSGEFKAENEVLERNYNRATIHHFHRKRLSSESFYSFSS